MGDRGVSEPRILLDEPDSTVRARSPVLDERTMRVAAGVGPEVSRLVTAYEARVAACDHLAFDDLTGRIVYRCGDEVLFEGVVEPLAKLQPKGVLTFAWRKQQPDLVPPTPRVEAARALLASLKLHAMLFGELAMHGAPQADIDALLLLALHLYEADGVFREERGGATLYYAVFEGNVSPRPGTSGRLAATFSTYRPRVTTRPIPREEGDAEVPRIESVPVPDHTPLPTPSPAAAALLSPRDAGGDAGGASGAVATGAGAGPGAAEEANPKSVRRMIPSPALGVILPIAQIVFTDLAALLERVRSAVLLVNVLRDAPLTVRADVMATDGEGELHVFEASPHLHEAVCAMVEQESAAGRAEWRRLAVHVSANASIKAQAR